MMRGNSSQRSSGHAAYCSFVLADPTRDDAGPARSNDWRICKKRKNRTHRKVLGSAHIMAAERETEEPTDKTLKEVEELGKELENTPSENAKPIQGELEMLQLMTMVMGMMITGILGYMVGKW